MHWYNDYEKYNNEMNQNNYFMSQLHNRNFDIMYGRWSSIMITTVVATITMVTITTVINTNYSNYQHNERKEQWLHSINIMCNNSHR